MINNTDNLSPLKDFLVFAIKKKSYSIVKYLLKSNNFELSDVELTEYLIKAFTRYDDNFTDFKNYKNPYKIGNLLSGSFKSFICKNYFIK